MEKSACFDLPPSHPQPNLPPKRGKELVLWLFLSISFRPEQLRIFFELLAGASEAALSLLEGFDRTL